MIIGLGIILFILGVILWWPFKLTVVHKFPPHATRLELGFMHQKWLFYNSFAANAPPDESLATPDALGDTLVASVAETAASAVADSASESHTVSEDPVIVDLTTPAPAAHVPEVEHYSYDEFYSSTEAPHRANFAESSPDHAASANKTTDYTEYTHAPHTSTETSKPPRWSSRSAAATLLDPQSIKRSYATLKSLTVRFGRIFRVDFRQLNLHAPLHDPANFGMFLPWWEYITSKYQLTRHWNLTTDWQSDNWVERVDLTMVIKWRIGTVFWFLLHSIFDLLVLAIILFKHYRNYRDSAQINKLAAWKLWLLDYFFPVQESP